MREEAAVAYFKILPATSLGGSLEDGWEDTSPLS
jgi:hypothetical protein